MSKRENQIRQELAFLKIEMNSKYGSGSYEVGDEKIFDRITELKEELKLLNQNKIVRFVKHLCYQHI